VQGGAQLSEEGAAALAAMLASIRGPGAPGTTPAECKHVTPAFLADFNAVRGHLARSQSRTVWGPRAQPESATTTVGYAGVAKASRLSHSLTAFRSVSDEAGPS